MSFDSSSKVAELKEELAQRGLSTQGKKAELLDRLNSYMATKTTQYKKKTVKELKVALKKRRLSLTGKKSDLLFRLVVDDEQKAAEEKETKSTKKSTPRKNTPKKSTPKSSSKKKTSSASKSKKASPKKVAEPVAESKAQTSPSEETEDDDSVDSGDLALCTSLIMLSIVLTGYNGKLDGAWKHFTEGQFDSQLTFLTYLKDPYFQATYYLVFLSLTSLLTAPVCSFFTKHYALPAIGPVILHFLLNTTLNGGSFNGPDLFLVYVHAAFVWTISSHAAQKVWEFFGSPKDLSVYEFSEPRIAQLAARLLAVIGACKLLDPADYRGGMQMYGMLFVVVYHSLSDFCRLIM